MGYVGDLVQAYIDHVGYTVSSRAIAKKIGVTGGAVDKWRAGTALPRPQHVKALAALIGVPEKTLLDAATLDAGYLADAADLDGYNDENQQEILDAIAEDERDDPPASPARRRRLG